MVWYLDLRLGICYDLEADTEEWKWITMSWVLFAQVHWHRICKERDGQIYSPRQRLEFHPLTHGSCPHKSMQILVSLVVSSVIPSDYIFSSLLFPVQRKVSYQVRGWKNSSVVRGFLWCLTMNECKHLAFGWSRWWNAYLAKSPAADYNIINHRSFE